MKYFIINLLHMLLIWLMMMISQFNSTSTPKGSYSVKTGVNCPMSLNSLRTALCESIHYQAKSEQNLRQDLIPRVRHGEAALVHPATDMP